jgi:opacity protein-like surface antigen
LSGGYQFLNFVVNGENESMPVGWYFDVAGNLTPMIGLVFQVGGNYKTFDEALAIGGITATATADLDVHEFLGGVRLNLRTNKAVVPFGQVLMGGINGSVKVSASATIPGQAPIVFDDEDSTTDFGIQAGGGVNFGLTDTIGLRAGADYLHVFAEGDGANLFRFHVGVVIGR